MKVNESNLDRIIRAVVGLVLLVLFFAGMITGGWGIVAAALGAILLLTGAVGFCPLYAVLKIKTNKSS
ncbi:MAG: DUF2892 domain-containing protein [Anaerolineaceae bacterium]